MIYPVMTMPCSRVPDALTVAHACMVKRQKTRIVMAARRINDSPYLGLAVNRVWSL